MAMAIQTEPPDTPHTAIYCAGTSQLRGCMNYVFRLFLNDANGFYAPSMVPNALPRHRVGALLFYDIILTASKPLRKRNLWQCGVSGGSCELA